MGLLMQEFISNTYAIISSHWIFVAISALFFLFRHIVTKIYKEPDSRSDLISMIRRGSWRPIYQSIIISFLIWLDRVILSKDDFNKIPARSIHRAYSFYLYEINLAICMAYPIIFFYLQTQFGPVKADLAQWLVGGNLTGWRLFCAILGLFGLPVIGLLSRWIKSPCGRIYVTIIGYFWGVLLVGSAAGSDFGLHINPFAGGEGRAFADDLMGPATLSIALFVGLTMRPPSIGSHILLLTAIGISLTWNFYELSDLSFLPKYSFSWADDFGSTLLLIDFYFYFYSAIFVTLISSSLIMQLIVNKAKLSKPLHIGIIQLAASASIIIARYSAGYGLPSYIMLLVFLPILNSLFDFVSTSVTRFSLRQGVRKIGASTLIWAFIDFTIGLSLSALLFVSFYFSVETINILVGRFFSFEWATDSFFGGTVGGYLWLISTLASTIIPNIAHLSVVILSSGCFFFGPISRNKIAEYLESGKDHYVKREISIMILSAWIVFSFMIPVVIIYYVLDGMIDFFSAISEQRLHEIVKSLSWVFGN